jgi:hypothetical protein
MPVAGYLAGIPDGLNLGALVCVVGGVVTVPAAFVAALWVASRV